MLVGQACAMQACQADSAEVSGGQGQILPTVMSGESAAAVQTAPSGSPSRRKQPLFHWQRASRTSMVRAPGSAYVRCRRAAAASTTRIHTPSRTCRCRRRGSASIQGSGSSSGRLVASVTPMRSTSKQKRQRAEAASRVVAISSLMVMVGRLER